MWEPRCTHHLFSSMLSMCLRYGSAPGRVEGIIPSARDTRLSSGALQFRVPKGRRLINKNQKLNQKRAQSDQHGAKRLPTSEHKSKLEPKGCYRRPTWSQAGAKTNPNCSNMKPWRILNVACFSWVFWRQNCKHGHAHLSAYLRWKVQVWRAFFCLLKEVGNKCF